MSDTFLALATLLEETGGGAEHSSEALGLKER